MASRTANIDHTAHRYLSGTPAEAMATPLASLGYEALCEALVGGANDEANRVMARIIAKHGRKYTAEARELARAIAAGKAPLPPVPEYMIKASKG